MMFPLLTLMIAAALVSCTGGLSPSGTLPQIDGHAVTNVDAASVGGMTAHDVLSAVAQANGATETSAPNTTVRRDASGNFSAGTIAANLQGNATTATWAMGKDGGFVPAAGTLALPSEGNFFRVSGSTPIAAISARPAGARITLVFSDPVTLMHSATLALAGLGNYQFSPNDAIELVALSSGWRELSRQASLDSEIYYVHSGTTPHIQLHDATVATLAYDTKILDTQNEYNAATGIFTAKQWGIYHFNAAYRTDAILWTISDYCQASIIPLTATATNVPLLGQSVVTRMPNTTAACYAHITATLRLAPGNAVRIGGYTSIDVFTPNVAADSSIYFVHITRVARP